MSCRKYDRKAFQLLSSKLLCVRGTTHILSDVHGSKLRTASIGSKLNVGS